MRKAEKKKKEIWPRMYADRTDPDTDLTAKSGVIS